jgi:dTDP-glucose 4,6-dehydratase
MKKILITGASGFLGSHVIRHLLINTDWELVCLINKNHSRIPKRIELSVKGYDESFERIKLIRHNLSEKISEDLSKEIGSIDYVINVASHSSVNESIDNPVFSIQNNVLLMCNLLEWARKNPIKKFIQVSSDEVYGPAAEGYSHKEWISPYLPSTPYSAGKASQESICFAYWRTYGIPVVIVNTMNLIGETITKDKFFVKIINNILSKNKIQIHGSKDGKTGGRYYIHARNQADAILHILSLPAPLYGESEKPAKFHVVGDKETTNLELVEIISKSMGEVFDYEIIDIDSVRPGYGLRYSLDGEKLINTGWKPPISFEESLDRTIKWTLQNKEWL